MYEELERRVTDVEFDALETLLLTKGTNWALGALTLALIDAGAIDQKRLAAIIDSLRTHLQADAVGRIGDVRYAERALDTLDYWLSCREWSSGQVVEDLVRLEGSAPLQPL